MLCNVSACQWVCMWFDNFGGSSIYFGENACHVKKKVSMEQRDGTNELIQKGMRSQSKPHRFLNVCKTFHRISYFSDFGLSQSNSIIIFTGKWKSEWKERYNEGDANCMVRLSSVHIYINTCLNAFHASNPKRINTRIKSRQLNGIL